MYNSAYSYPPEQCVLLPYMQFAHKTTPKRCAKLRKQNIALHSISPDNLKVSHNNHGNVPYLNCQVSKLLYLTIIIS